MSDRNPVDAVVFDEMYPARRILSLLSNKWVPIVLYCLSHDVKRFGQMERALPGISKKMLAQVLKALERDGLVSRTVHQRVPLQTDYALTALGRRLHEPVQLLCQWAADNQEVLMTVESNRQQGGAAARP